MDLKLSITVIVQLLFITLTCTSASEYTFIEDDYTDIAPHLTTLRGSVFGDPHVTIEDVNEIKFCYDLNSAGPSIQLFYFSNSDAPEFIVEADIAACGDHGQTCIEDISIQLNGDSVHFNFVGITHNGETRPWSQLDPWVINNVFMIRNVGETSNEFKRVSIYPDVELTIRRFQHDISFIGIIFHDLGMYWDLEDPMTGVVGDFLKSTFIYNPTNSHLEFDTYSFPVREVQRLNPATRQVESCYLYDGPDAYQFFFGNA